MAKARIYYKEITARTTNINEIIYKKIGERIILPKDNNKVIYKKIGEKP
jgi:hypothetical protein